MHLPLYNLLFSFPFGPYSLESSAVSSTFLEDAATLFAVRSWESMAALGEVGDPLTSLHPILLLHKHVEFSIEIDTKFSAEVSFPLW
jgi:hypothetical protein